MIGALFADFDQRNLAPEPRAGLLEVHCQAANQNRPKKPRMAHAVPPSRVRETKQRCTAPPGTRRRRPIILEIPDQQRPEINPRLERMPWCRHQFRVRNPDVFLLFPLLTPTHCHAAHSTNQACGSLIYFGQVPTKIFCGCRMS